MTAPSPPPAGSEPPAGTDEVEGLLLPPDEAVEWASDHYVVSAEFDDEGGADLNTRPATWRDAPTKWGEAVDHFAAALAPWVAQQRAEVGERTALAIEAERDRRSNLEERGALTAAARIARADRIAPTTEPRSASCTCTWDMSGKYQTAICPGHKALLLPKLFGERKQ